MSITHISKTEYLRLRTKTPKYKNKLITNALGQVENHSKKENQFAKDLYLELSAGKYKEVAEQVKVPLIVNGTHICDYVVDFRVVYNDLREEFIEVKGFMTQTAKLKINLFRALFPDKTLLVIR